MDNSNNKNVALMCGAPAECQTICESLKRQILRAEKYEASRKNKKKSDPRRLQRVRQRQRSSAKNVDNQRMREMKRIDTESKKTWKENRRIRWPPSAQCWHVSPFHSHALPRNHVSKVFRCSLRAKRMRNLSLASCRRFWRRFSGETSVRN